MSNYNPPQAPQFAPLGFAPQGQPQQQQPQAPQYQQAPQAPQYPPQGFQPPQMPQMPQQAPPQAPQGQPQGFAPPAPYGAPQAPQAPPAAPMQMPQGFTPPQAPQGQAFGYSPFAGMNQAQVFSRGQKFDANTEKGLYVCIIKDVIFKPNGTHGPTVIVEMEVAESTNPNVAPGVKRSWTCNLRDTRVAFPNLVSFLAAAYGYNSNDNNHVQIINSQIGPQSEGLLTKAFNEKNLNGRKVKVAPRLHTAKPKPGQQQGNVLTVVDWAPAAQ